MKNSYRILLMYVVAALAFGACRQGNLVCPNCETDSETAMPTGPGVETDEDAAVPASTGLFVLRKDFNGQTTGEPNLEIVADSEVVRKSAFADHNTVTVVGGEECLKVHAMSSDDAFERGKGVQIAMPLDREADMRNEDFVVAFDIYVSEADLSYNYEPVFGLCEAGKNSCIFSKWYPAPLESGWHHIEGEVRATGGDIVFSNIESDPGDWIFDALRIYVFIHDVKDNVAVAFCLDNIQVYRP